MRAIILHGGTSDHSALEAVHLQLCETLRAAGIEIETLRLAQMTIGPCKGCFGCWMRTPGECVIDDDGRTVARGAAQSDINIFLTPVSFGGYGSLLKSAVDRLVPNISPLFQKMHGEMHHRKRYPQAAQFFAIGWQQQAHAESAGIFAQLVERNAINMHAPAYGSLVLTGEQSAEEQLGQIAALLGKVKAQV